MIAVIGDTHLPRGTRRLPEACRRLLAEASLIVHVGDFTAASVLEELGELAPVAAVHGNVDEPELRARLPERLVIEIGGLRIGAVHDAGRRPRRHERLRALFRGCDIIAFGHTHHPELAREGEAWIVNPGSPTERRRAATRSMAVIHGGKPSLVELEP